MGAKYSLTGSGCEGFHKYCQLDMGPVHLNFQELGPVLSHGVKKSQDRPVGYVLGGGNIPQCFVKGFHFGIEAQR